jgi:galactokinase/mevalonate kinase-like predicted kinase
MAQLEIIDSRDEVLEEVWKIKRELNAAMNNDVDRILEDARQQELKSGRVILQPPSRSTTTD